jgi:hypothetical protein
VIIAGIITELNIQKLDILETTVQYEELWQKEYSQQQNKTVGNVSYVHYLFKSLYLSIQCPFIVGMGNPSLGNGLLLEVAVQNAAETVTQLHLEFYHPCQNNSSFSKVIS